MHPSEFGTPGKIPPVLTGTAGVMPPFEQWDPEGDVSAPLMGADTAYVPTIVRVPPQLPRPEQHPRPAEFEARGYEAFFTAGNVGLPSHQLNFIAKSVQVDNYSNQWQFLPSVRRWVPPASVGWIFVIVPGAITAQIVAASPPGTHAAGTVGAAGDPVVSVWHELFLTPTGGVVLTV
jgi:hypothetical protein